MAVQDVIINDKSLTKADIKKARCCKGAIKCRLEDRKYKQERRIKIAKLLGGQDYHSLP